jgi:adenine-specific DNA-methyltransferase
VLIVTVDEYEVHHLGVLLEQLFPATSTQLVIIVNNLQGVTQPRFSRVAEYAYFGFFGEVVVAGPDDGLLTPLAEEDSAGDGRPRSKGLLRSGDAARREDRPNMFFPVLVDSDRKAVVGVREPPWQAGGKTWPEPNLDEKVAVHEVV